VGILGEHAGVGDRAPGLEDLADVPAVERAGVADHAHVPGVDAGERRAAADGEHDQDHDHRDADHGGARAGAEARTTAGDAVSG